MNDDLLERGITPAPYDPSGGNAFPFEGGENNNSQPHSGMSLRDYLAAKAMQGELSAHTNVRADVDFIASLAYRMADAMLKQREVKND